MSDDRPRADLLRWPTRDDARVFVGFTALVVVAMAALFFLVRGVLNDVLRPWGYTASSLLVVPVVLGPPVVAAWNVYRGGTLPGSVAVGLAPTAAIAVVFLLGSLAIGGGEPGVVLGLAIVYGVYGVAGATVGTLISLAVVRARQAVA